MSNVQESWVCNGRAGFSPHKTRNNDKNIGLSLEYDGDRGEISKKVCLFTNDKRRISSVTGVVQTSVRLFYELRLVGCTK